MAPTSRAETLSSSTGPSLPATMSGIPATPPRRHPRLPPLDDGGQRDPHADHLWRQLPERKHCPVLLDRRSRQLCLEYQQHPPDDTHASPLSMTADNAIHTLTIYGANFQSGNIVQFYWTVAPGNYVWNTSNTPPTTPTPPPSR